MASSSSSNLAKPTKLKLTYFNIEGAAEPIRLALALAQFDYEDDRVAFPDWQALKPQTPYGQLPLMTLNGDESHVKTQSGAMLRYVGQVLAPDLLYPPESFWEIEQVLGVMDDFRKSLEPALYLGMRPERFGYPAGFGQTEPGKVLLQSMRTTWVEQELPKYAKYLEQWLDKHNGQWMASRTSVTIADCAVVPFLRSLTRGHMDHIPTTCLQDVSPKLVDYVQRFCALPQIQGRYKDGLN
ncbi:hypothetical protein ACA910_008755 [Epithemia clementina (nom. ined.)]